MRTVTGPTERVVVVGAGLGGLACALHLAGAGREHVEILGGKPSLEQFHVRRDVVDYKNSGGHLNSVTGYARGSPTKRCTVSRKCPTEMGLEM